MADTKVTEDAPMPMVKTPKEAGEAEQTAADAENSSVEETSQNGHTQEQKGSATDKTAATEENGAVKAEEKDANKSLEGKDAGEAPMEIDADKAPEEKDADKAPKEKDADKAPKEKDADKAPKEKDADKAPKEKDADKAPKEKDADKALKEKDADKAPNKKDADKAPNKKDADKAPNKRDADKAPKEKDADKAPKEEDAEKASVDENTEAPAEEDIALEDVKHDPELFKKIVKQIEYYFGNYNLPRDKFLSAEVKKDDGWVPLTVMLKFARLRKLTSSASVIVATIKASKDSIMEVDESNKKIRRSPTEPLPELSEGLQEEAIKRTIYAKNFPKDGSITLDLLLEFFKPFGEYDSVRMRNYVDRTTNAQGFKGSVLVVFKTPELAQKFLEMTVRYKKTVLDKMWFGKYLEIKKNEMEERLARKQARLNKAADANGEDKAAAQFEDLPRGNFLRATGFADKTTREDIKSSVFDMTNDCAFVDFRKGDEQAYIRFSEAGSNKQILAALEGNLTVNGAKISLFLVEGEEEEAQLTKANEARRKSHASGPHSKKRKQGGGYGGRGGKNKRQRTK